MNYKISFKVDNMHSVKICQGKPGATHIVYFKQFGYEVLILMFPLCRCLLMTDSLSWGSECGAARQGSCSDPQEWQ